jgi:hypothetical protein
MMIDYGCRSCHYWRRLIGAECYACQFILESGKSADREDNVCRSWEERETAPALRTPRRMPTSDQVYFFRTGRSKTKRT